VPSRLSVTDFDFKIKGKELYLISKKELKVTLNDGSGFFMFKTIQYNITPKIRVNLAQPLPEQNVVDASQTTQKEPSQTTPAKAEIPSGLTFAVASDLHVQSSYVPGKLKKNLEQIINKHPELIILTGDLTDADPGQKGVKIDKMWSRFKQGVFDRLTSNNIIVAPALGNHDAYNKYQKDSYSRFWKTNKQSSLESIITKESNYPLYYSFDYKNNHFVILDTNKEYISPSQLRWLKEDLESANADHIFVFGHHPLKAPCTTYWCHRSSGLQPTSELVKIFKDYDITLLTTGHAHYYRKGSYQGINTLLMGSTTYNRRYDAEKQDEMFVMVNVDKDKVVITPFSYEGKRLKEDWLLPKGYSELTSSVVS
jgi:3',5'-cyclic AMP phosphodiesterase CpdA